MRQLIFCLCFLILNCNGLYAKENALTDLKILPLPNNRLRIDFQFADEVKQSPASFITEKPQRLVLDFIDSSNQLDAAARQKTLKLGSVQNYQVVSVGKRVRVMFNLSAAITYSGFKSGHAYTLLINGVGKELIPRPHELYVTH